MPKNNRLYLKGSTGSNISLMCNDKEVSGITKIVIEPIVPGKSIQAVLTANVSLELGMHLDQVSITSCSKDDLYVEEPELKRDIDVDLGVRPT